MDTIRPIRPLFYLICLLEVMFIVYGNTNYLRVPDGVAMFKSLMHSFHFKPYSDYPGLFQINLGRWWTILRCQVTSTYDTGFVT